MPLTPNQQLAYDKIIAFLKDKDSQVFILKGYAGTGKTFMTAALLQEIERMGKHSLLLAPTGRAAKVLRDKTGHVARTIHNAIYSKAKIKTIRCDDDEILIKDPKENSSDIKDFDKVDYFFELKNISSCTLKDGSKMLPEKTVIIVDESSLISSKATKGEVFHFGTDILLDDLLTFSQLHLGAKIIFVGDPAQLSPVGDNNSNALREDFFAEKGLNVSSAELTEIQRQSGDGMILKNAMKIRNLLDEPMRYSLSFDYRDSEFEMLSSTEVIQRFCAAQPTPQFGENIVICFSNTLVKEYNDRIRRIYFPGCDGVQCGDILQIVKTITITFLCSMALCPLTISTPISTTVTL